MALTQKEFRKRAVAGAALHGATLRGLRDLLEAYGADRTLYVTMYRDERARGLPRNIRDISEALDLPRDWFLKADWRDLIKGATRRLEEKGDLPRLDEDVAQATGDLGADEDLDEPEEGTAADA